MKHNSFGAAFRQIVYHMTAEERRQILESMQAYRIAKPEESLKVDIAEKAFLEVWADADKQTNDH